MTVHGSGSAMSLGASVLPVLDQLGILEDFKKISLPCYTADMYNDKLETIGSLNMKGHDNLYDIFIDPYQRSPESYDEKGRPIHFEVPWWLSNA